jgi:hypothetical protein
LLLRGEAIPPFWADSCITSAALQNDVALGSLNGKSRFLMIDGPGYDAPSREGKAYLLFLRRDQLRAQPFAAGTAALSEEPVIIAETSTRRPSFSASENGVLIFRRSRGTRAQLTWLDRDGKSLGTAGDADRIFSPRISSDQKSVAFHRFDGMSTDIWLVDEERNTTRFTFWFLAGLVAGR